MLLLRAHLNQHLTPIIKDIKGQIHSLIGMAGTFEIFRDHLSKKAIDTNYHVIDMDKVDKFCNTIIAMDLEDRKSHPLVPEVRAQYVVTALILIQQILYTLKPRNFVVSNLSIKEGIVYDELAQQDTK